MHKLLLILSILILSGCMDSKERWEWAVNFCGGEKNVLWYSGTLNEVRCTDMRLVEIPSL